MAAFVNAPSPRRDRVHQELSEALNLVAYAISNATTFPGAERFRIGPGDEIVVTEMEHHSNIVPWQLLCAAHRRDVPLAADRRRRPAGRTAIDEVINARTKIVAFVHQSNALGTINPVARLVERAREVGALTVLDASQSAPHLPARRPGARRDLLAFTGHKLYGPTGVGVLWGSYDLLAELPPFMGGGEMIETVDMAGTTYAAPPHRFEAGTPMIAEAVGLGAAVDYLTAIGMDAVPAHERELVDYALPARRAAGPAIIGPATKRRPWRHHRVHAAGHPPARRRQLLDEHGIAVRAGHHCARPVCVRYGVPATTRASFGIYTTTDEIDALVAGLDRVKEMFG